MKKRLFSILLLCALLLSTLAFTSCGQSPEEGEVTRMTVDINPSVEFMVDDQNKVISVTALNDDGGILIVGEAFLGKTPEEAVALMVTLATETGYLVKGQAEATENTVKISVSGDSGYAEQLKKDVTKKADDTMRALNVHGQVKQVAALATDALRQLALSTSLYTEEELAAMDEGQLYRVISLARVETAHLLTEEMRVAYHTAKEYEISFARREETAKVIEGLGGLYTLVHTAYKSALDLYSTAITELDEFRYEMLVSPDSEYQKALSRLREAKVELLKQKNYTATLEVNGEEYASATATLRLSEQNYSRMLSDLERIGDELNATLEALIAALRQAEATLIELETHFDANVQEKLTQKAAEIEATLNAAKDGFFAEFEAAHADDIEGVEASLLAKKQELRAELEGT